MIFPTAQNLYAKDDQFMFASPVTVYSRARAPPVTGAVVQQKQNHYLNLSSVLASVLWKPLNVQVKGKRQ